MILTLMEFEGNLTLVIQVNDAADPQRLIVNSGTQSVDTMRALLEGLGSDSGTRRSQALAELENLRANWLKERRC